VHVATRRTGDVVTITGVVKAVDGETATCELTALSQAGATILIVEAVVRRARQVLWRARSIFKD